MGCIFLEPVQVHLQIRIFIDAMKKIDTRSMAKRLFSTLLLWGIVAAVLLSGQVLLVVGTVIVLTVLGAVEYVMITRSTPGHKRRLGSFAIAVIYLLWLAYDLVSTNNNDEIIHKQNDFSPEMICLLLTLFVAFLMTLWKEIRGMDSINAVATNVLGFIYIPILFGGFMMRLAFLPPVTAVSSPEISGVWLLLFVAIVTKFTDMGAYLTGTLFGSTKMIKHISPGKTWEGTIGSFAVAQGGAFGVWFLAGDRLDWMGAWWNILILGVLISIAAIIGDLAESILKRSVETKDSGGMLPGIGGVLDLIDSICFAAPVAYFYLYFTAIH